MQWTEGLVSPSLLSTLYPAGRGQGPNNRGLFEPFYSPAGASEGDSSNTGCQNVREEKTGDMGALLGKSAESQS